MKLVARLLCLSVLLGLAAPVPALAADANSPVLGRIVQNGKLRVGMSGSQPPLNFRGKSGEMMGMEVDLASGLAALMEAELEIVVKPFGELTRALEKGEIDMVISGMTITAERNLKAAFVGPYFLSGKSILTKATSPLARATQTSDLNSPGIRLAALAGSTSENFVKALMPNATLVATKDYDKAVEQLLAGNADPLVADYPIVALTAFRYPIEDLTASQQPLTIEPIGIAVPPGDALMLNFLENALEALEISGTLQSLQARWFKQKDWLKELP